MGYGAPLPSTPSILFPSDDTFAIVGAGKTHVTCEMVDQSRATGEDPILKYAKYVHNAFKLTGDEVLYFTYMNSVANKAGHGCVTLQSSLAQGLLDEPVECYLRPKSRKFKSLCAKIRYVKVRHPALIGRNIGDHATCRHWHCDVGALGLQSRAIGGS